MVDGRVLEPSDGAEVLQRALTEGRDEILWGLEEYRRYIQELNPGAEVSLAPFSVMKLGTHPKEVLSKIGLERKKHFEQLYPNIDDIREEFHPLWQAVEASGFIPEVRLHVSSRSEWGPQYLWARIPHAGEKE